MEYTILFLFTSCLLIQVCGGLDCFSCASAWTVRECMQQDPLTCGTGEMCSSTVTRGGFTAEKKYTKGCMEVDLCLSLQNLNQRQFCDREPAVCVYCCDTELCNVAVTSLPGHIAFYVLTSSLAVMVFR